VMAKPRAAGDYGMNDLRALGGTDCRFLGRRAEPLPKRAGSTGEPKSVFSRSTASSVPMSIRSSM
jgi:hypothetical protein